MNLMAPPTTSKWRQNFPLHSNKFIFFMSEYAPYLTFVRRSLFVLPYLSLAFEKFMASTSATPEVSNVSTLGWAGKSSLANGRQWYEGISHNHTLTTHDRQNKSSLFLFMAGSGNFRSF
jgi:hypothetical protein